MQAAKLQSQKARTGELASLGPKNWCVETGAVFIAVIGLMTWLVLHKLVQLLLRRRQQLMLPFWQKFRTPFVVEASFTRAPTDPACRTAQVEWLAK
jgi:hypothetical protein